MKRKGPLSKEVLKKRFGFWKAEYPYGLFLIVCGLSIPIIFNYGSSNEIIFNYGLSIEIIFNCGLSLQIIFKEEKGGFEEKGRL